MLANELLKSTQTHRANWDNYSFSQAYGRPHGHPVPAACVESTAYEPHPRHLARPQRQTAKTAFNTRKGGSYNHKKTQSLRNDNEGRLRDKMSETSGIIIIRS